MKKISTFTALLDKVKEKHGTLADAMRAADVDPSGSDGRLLRRTIERRITKDSANLWDLLALRGLLSFRRRKR